MNTQKINIGNTRLDLDKQLELGERMSFGDLKAREELILSCVPLVKSFAGSPLCQQFSSYDDAFQDGMLGVLEASYSYDYTKKVMFTTYAYKYIHKKIYEGIMKQASVKISRRDFFNTLLLNSTISTFYAAYQVSPTNEQLVTLTALPLKDIVFYQKQNFTKMTYSIDSDDFDESLLCVAADDMFFVVNRALKVAEQRNVLDKALQVLTDEEREIIERRFFYTDHKATFKEIAESQDITTDGVAKREKCALKKLLAYFVANNISFNDLV